MESIGRRSTRMRIVVGLLIIAAALIAAAAVPSLAHADSGSWSRFGAGEKDGYRYGTNAFVAQDGWQSADTVVIAKGTDYPDALAVSALAGKHGAPVLLTETGTLTEQTARQIDRLSPSKAYVLGDENSISSSVVKALEKKGIAVQRLAGTEKTGYRIGTALEIYKEGKGSWGSTAIVVAGDSFADALSISPLAYAEGYPIFLAQSKDHTLDSATATAIKTGGFAKVLLIGGTDRVSDKVKSQLSGMACERIAGSDRYRTSALVADYAVADSPKIAYNNLVVTTGSKPFDALGGGALAGKRGTVLLLADDGDAGSYCVDSVVAKNAAVITFGTFLGDANSVSAKLAQRFEAAAASSGSIANPASDFEYAVGDYFVRGKGVLTGNPKDLEYHRAEGDGEDACTVTEGPGCALHVEETGTGSGVGSTIGTTGYNCGYGVYITKYKGSHPNIVVPRQINGIDVVCVALESKGLGAASIDVSTCGSLKAFDVGRGELGQKPADALKSITFGTGLPLENVYVESAPVSTLHGLNSLGRLKELGILGTDLTTLDLFGLTSLEHLVCVNNNRITDTSDLDAWLAQDGHTGYIG